MLSQEEIKLYLPKYLSPEQTDNLLHELNQFPGNINKRLYSHPSQQREQILQGDGIRSLPVVSFPNNTIKEVPVMVISNSCDNNPENIRMYTSRICYCPLVKLNKYQERLLNLGAKRQAVEDQLKDIKNQELSQVFYLPRGASLEEEYIVFFNTILNCDTNHIFSEQLNEQKLFSLSDYGIYLFIFKLSIFMTRLNEGISRDF